MKKQSFMEGKQDLILENEMIIEERVVRMPQKHIIIKGKYDLIQGKAKYQQRKV
jgi:hypothetical protein